MKVYKSKRWMELKYLKQRLTEEEIAEEANTTQPTINKWLKIHGIHRSQR